LSGRTTLVALVSLPPVLGVRINGYRPKLHSVRAQPVDYK